MDGFARGMISERQRLLEVLSGRKPDRVPVISPGGMMTMASREVMLGTGNVWPESHRDPFKMAELSIAMHDAAGIENLGIPFCMTVEAEAWGGEVEDGDGFTEPSIVKYPLDEVSGWRGLKPLDPARDGRLPSILESTRILKEKRPETPVIGNLVGPLSLATSILDAVTLYKALRKDPAEAHSMLGFITENCVNYGRALIGAGADVIVIADPSATGEILGPRLFCEFALPYINRITKGMHGLGAPVIVHICGDLRPVYGVLGGLVCECLSVDSAIDMAVAKRELPSKLLMGNVSTRLLHKGPAEQIRKVSEKLAGMVDILAPACGISSMTPVKHIRAMTEAARA